MNINAVFEQKKFTLRTFCRLSSIRKAYTIEQGIKSRMPRKRKGEKKSISLFSKIEYMFAFTKIVKFGYHQPARGSI